jgi:hypothetical protein
MPFDTFTPRLKFVATTSLIFCRGQWGGNGLRREQPIDDRIGWTPTFYMRPTRASIIAIEVGDVLFPELLKIAAHDIQRDNFPVAVYQACALDLYQKDPNFRKANLLREHGFGIITVDDAGNCIIQCRAEPLPQHIPTSNLEERLKPLTPRLKVKFRAAYATYQTNIGQGLQEAGQIVEALVDSVARQAEAAGVVPAGTINRSTADIIDELYPTGHFHNYRATLGAARDFARTYRNISSHPAGTPQELARKINRCKTGFFEALRIAGELRSMSQALSYPIRII